MAKHSTEFLIVGAGINGLLTAYELLKAGCEVMVVDKGMAGGESSWAGGGILSPLYPWRYPDAVNRLALCGTPGYRQLAEELLATTGIDIECVTSGLLVIEQDEWDEAKAFCERFMLPLEHCDEKQLRLCEPNLIPRPGAMRFPTIGQVRNPRLIQALNVFLSQNGVAVREHCEVHEFLRKGAVIEGVVSGQGTIAAEHTVIASGAWSGRLLSRLGVEVPIQPVRGQMLMFQTSVPVLTHICLEQGHYLIPRRDGHILVGSTLEDAGFEKTCTRAANRELKAFAFKLLPRLQNAIEIAQWAGLRPAKRDGVPIIGVCPYFQGLWLNAGQFRNGLVMAPASARLLADMLLQRPLKFDASPYQWPKTGVII